MMPVSWPECQCSNPTTPATYFGQVLRAGILNAGLNSFKTELFTKSEKRGCA